MRTASQKTRNLERDPRVAISILDPNDGYRYLEIRGRVVRVEADPDGVFLDAMSMKYLGVDKYPYGKPDDEYIVLVIKPVRTTHMG